MRVWEREWRRACRSARLGPRVEVSVAVSETDAPFDLETSWHVTNKQHRTLLINGQSTRAHSHGRGLRMCMHLVVPLLACDIVQWTVSHARCIADMRRISCIAYTYAVRLRRAIPTALLSVHWYLVNMRWVRAVVDHHSICIGRLCHNVSKIRLEKYSIRSEMAVLLSCIGRAATKSTAPTTCIVQLLTTRNR